MEISKQELLRESLETGFRPEIMEKVWHLMAILDGISVHPHCQNGCKERVKAEEANLVFSDYLKSFQVHSEVSNLYMAIIDDIFKTKEGNREKEIDRFQKNLAELETKLFKVDEMYVAGDLEKDSYQRVKVSTKDEIQQLQAHISRLTSTDTNFMKYCRYGMSLLGNLDFHYQESSPYVRKKLLGSIFTGKLIFEDGKYRTLGLNEAVALIGQFQQEFGHKKAEHLAISDKTFGNVPSPAPERSRTNSSRE